MAGLNVEVLCKIIENLPEDFTVEYMSNDGIVHYVSDKVEVDISQKKLVLKP